MTEFDLLTLWSKARLHLILSQVAPTFLLIVTIGLLDTGLGDAPFSVRLAAAGILLASGVLGVVSQVSAANEARAIADDLRAIGASATGAASSTSAVSAVSARVVAQRPFTDVVRYVGPAVFVVVFLALLWSLFAA